MFSDLNNFLRETQKSDKSAKNEKNEELDVVEVASSRAGQEAGARRCKMEAGSEEEREESAS